MKEWESIDELVEAMYGNYDDCARAGYDWGYQQCEEKYRNLITAAQEALIDGYDTPTFALHDALKEMGKIYE